MPLTTFKRYEKKFLLDEAQKSAVLPELSKHLRYDENCSDGREYSIYNIYYDTHDSSLISRSLSKPYYKEKLRLRSYSIPASINSRVFLELKKKIGGIVSKRRAVLSLSEAYQFLDKRIYPRDAGYMNTQVLKEIAYFLECHDLRAAAYIAYQRSALIGIHDNDFRITLDHSIITRRNELCLEKGLFGEDLLPGRYLMEVKVPAALPMWLVDLLSEHKIYSTSFSKYGQEYNQNLRNSGYDVLRKAS